MEWVNEAALCELLAFVADNPHSSFYKDKFARAGVEPTLASFKRLPFLSRRELTDSPVSERTYVAPEDVRFVAFTSGTSSRVPLITPFGDVDNYFVEPSLGLSVARPLIIYPPLNKNFGASFIQQCRQAKHPVSPMFADFQNLANSAIVAREMRCDSIYATPTLAHLFVEHAMGQGVIGNIKLLALCSEVLTRARRDELQAAYPEARIANLYASSEIGQFAMFPCMRMIKEDRAAFHLNTQALAAAELVDGELVVSYGLNKAMPLVRYRTGDYFEVAQPCACGLPGPVLSWSHRDTDRVRINGLEFTAEEADRVMGELPNMPVPEYQVHFYEGEGAIVRMHVEIVGSPEPELEALLTRELGERWRLSSSALLKDAIERGLIADITVALVPAVSDRGAKAKRFVTHAREA